MSSSIWFLNIYSFRANGQPGKRRPAGDGMDAEMDDPELIFEVPDQMRDCQCACDHMIYGRDYRTCLQVSFHNFLVNLVPPRRQKIHTQLNQYSGKTINYLNVQP